MKVRTVAVVVALVAIAGVVGIRAATDEPRRPPLRLPAASAFPAGPCRDAAEAVLALGRFTYEHAGASGLPADAYPFLRQRAAELAAVRGAVTGEGAPGGGPSASGTPGNPTGSGAPGGMPTGGTPGSPGADPTATDPTVTDPAATGRATPDRAALDPVRQALSGRIDALLTAIGFVRLRPGKAYDPALLRDLEKARAELQQTCVSQA